MKGLVRQLGSLLFLLAVLPFLLVLARTAQYYLGKAAVKPANIVVDSQKELGRLAKPWQALAQGGEETGPMLGAIIEEVRSLKPSYIRLDHIYDFYSVVGRGSKGELIFNWRELDRAVDEILATGAKPFLSLSYMPAVLTSNGNPLSPPVSWQEWKEVVKKTIEHFSGERAIEGVYYEVWNEPDLFGNFKIKGKKSYLELYRWAQQGAKEARGVKEFKLGGPATTRIYQSWIEELARAEKEQGWRWDFVSWHFYEPRVEEVVEDFKRVREWLFKYQERLGVKELIVSEWAYESEVDPANDGVVAAMHTLAVGRAMVNKIRWGFVFEIKDGLSPEGKTFWGRWGLLTHERVGKKKKPRFWAVDWLNRLEGKRLGLEGEGDYVKGLAVKDKEGRVKILLVNYDPEERHGEAVPVRVINLEKGGWRVVLEWFEGRREEERVVVDKGEWEKLLYMPANTAVMIGLEKES